MKIIKTLVQNENEKPIYIVRMCGDYNDADYSDSHETFNEKEFNEIAECLFEISKLVGRDYCNGKYEYKTVDEHIQKIFNKYDVEFEYPFGDTASGFGIHSLDSLEIQYIDIDGKIYDVTFE